MNRNPRPGAAAEAAPPALGWQKSAACRAADPDLFFAPEAERISVRQRREAKAKAVCAGCPVREVCLDFAVREPMRTGIWGGADESERARMRRTYLRHLRNAA